MIRPMTLWLITMIAAMAMLVVRVVLGNPCLSLAAVMLIVTNGTFIAMQLIKTDEEDR